MHKDRSTLKYIAKQSSKIISGSVTTQNDLNHFSLPSYDLFLFQLVHVASLNMLKASCIQETYCPFKHSINLCNIQHLSHPQTQEKKMKIWNVREAIEDNSRAKFNYIHYSLKSCYSLFIILFCYSLKRTFIHYILGHHLFTNHYHFCCLFTLLAINY